jgi:hypothetical protein
MYQDNGSILSLGKLVKGTPFFEPANEYTIDGTCIGIATIEMIQYARACAVAFCCILPVKNVKEEPFDFDMLFN